MTKSRFARRTAGGVGIAVACVLSFTAGTRVAPAPQESVEGMTFANGDLSVEVLFDGLARGVPVDIGLMTFPPGLVAGDHQHEQTEIFYVLEGELHHVVNGDTTVLSPGELGHVTPPDFVAHITPEDGGEMRALVMWSPAGGAARYGRIWERVGS